MNRYKWLALVAVAVSLPGCLVALSAQQAQASPTSERAYAYYNDAAHTTQVGEAASTCYSWHIELIWGVRTQYAELLWEEPC